MEKKRYQNENYAKEIKADDDQWAEDYDRADSRNGKAASASGTYPYFAKASKEFAGVSASDFDAWSRDQDFKEDVSYDRTKAKA